MSTTKRIGPRFGTVGMVAFVDLLGYSVRVQAIKTAADLRTIEADVRRVQAWFDYRADHAAVRAIQKLQSKRILAFSDCLVIAVPSRSEFTDLDGGDYDVLFSELVAFAYAQGQCAVNGIFIRGGIDYGLWYKRRDTIISPAMVAAYELEGQTCVPMIGISKPFRHYLRDNPQRNSYSKGEDPFRRYFKRVTVPGGKKQWVLDYFRLFLGEINGALTTEERDVYGDADPRTRDRMRSVAHARDLKVATLAHKQRILAARRAAKDPRVRLKYDWLADYHDDAVRRFFKKPPAELLIATGNKAKAK
jgi:hypothetical protein